MTTDDAFEVTLFEKLAEPFPTEVVSWRVGSTTKDKKKGMALAYVDARDVMQRLDIVCGPENWQDDFVNAGNGTTTCRIGIKIGSEWLWKSDGAGQTSYEGDKGQYSDAFKRAAVKWGIGRYLYDCDAPWVEIDERGNIAKHEMEKLNTALLKAGNRHEWGDRSSYNLYRLLKSSIMSFAQTPGLVSEFINSNQGVISQLRVGAKRQLEQDVNAILQKDAAIMGEYHA